MLPIHSDRAGIAMLKVVWSMGDRILVPCVRLNCIIYVCGGGRLVYKQGH